MDDADDDRVHAPGEVPCDVCGRPIQLSGTGLPGAPGREAGSVIDNRGVCKACQAGRYRSGRDHVTGKRRR